jgi:ribosomal-protein-alanine N-acetyltransferase
MDDLDSLAALYRDPDVRRYFPDGTRTYEETAEELAWIIDVYYSRYGYGLWATIDKETGQLIGRCGLLPWTIEERPEVEVAYLLAREYWGRGLATEAAQAIRDYAFEHLNMSRLICLIDPANHASRRVAEKTGMTLEKEVDGIDGDGIPTLIYSISKTNLS